MTDRRPGRPHHAPGRGHRARGWRTEDALASTALCLTWGCATDGSPLAHAQRVERVQCLGKQVRPMLYPFEASTELLTLSGDVVPLVPASG